MDTKVFLFQVRETSHKLRVICETAAEHFKNKEPLQIIVPDKTALEFVDALLWRMPEESFLPHSALSTASNELIAVTCERAILNQALAVFNLCLMPPLNCKVKTLYDFDDITSPDKKQASEKRYQAYREAGFQIINK